MSLKLLRHYIFIDPNDIHCCLDQSSVLNEIKQKHSQFYNNREIVRYWGYDDIVNLLRDHDRELLNLFLSINYNYPALLADIGRLLILYCYGGVYHDLKFISNREMLHFLTNLSNKITFIGEQFQSRVRIGNIISLQREHVFLDLLLKEIKKELIVTRNLNPANGRVYAYEIGSGTYIKEFAKHEDERVIKYPFPEKKLLTFDKSIYLMNIKRWQNTYEPLFIEQK